jgi:hypothetical protein
MNVYGQVVNNGVKGKAARIAADRKAVERAKFNQKVCPVKFHTITVLKRNDAEQRFEVREQGISSRKLHLHYRRLATA